MSKKTNPLVLRSRKNKDWVSKSFFENYNYSKLLYQDLYIQNYVKNIFQHRVNDSIIHDISIQRKKENIHIFVDYYQINSFLNSNFNPKKKDKLFSIKKYFKWKNKKNFYLEYMKLRQKGVSKYQKYTLRVLKVKRKNANTSVLLNKRFIKDKYVPVFSLKRLMVLNLSLLTGCQVNLYVRNIAHLSNFPMFVRDVPKLRNKVNSVKKVMSRLKIQSRVNKLNGLDTTQFIHLFYTSFIFKNPDLLGVFLSKILKKNIKSFNFFFNFFSRALLPLFVFSKLNGLKIQFKGRLGSSLRKRTSIISFGSMPLHTVDSIVKYSFNESITIYGICGVKVWYYY